MKKFVYDSNKSKVSYDKHGIDFEVAKLLGMIPSGSKFLQKP